MPTESDWEPLRDGFDSAQVLAAIDILDRLRAHLGDVGLRPPEMRDQLFTLHTLAANVINHGQLDAGRDLAELADELESRASDVLHQAEQLYELLHTLVALLPETVWEDDDEAGLNTV